MPQQPAARTCTRRAPGSLAVTGRRAAPVTAASAVTPAGVSLAAALALAWPEVAAAALHVEPGNALSVPTWAVHVASVAEWLIAMDLVWRYGNASGRPAWKGLSWGMLPLHASSLCACTYHLFYNSPSLSSLVTLQAGLTCFGNCTLAAAALRLASRYGDAPAAQLPRCSAPGDNDAAFLAKTLVGSLAGGAAVKYASLLSDLPFEPSLPLALAIILSGTAATGAALAARSAQEGASSAQ